MKVLYLSYDGMCDDLGRSQVIPYLQGLSNKGHRLHVISFEKKGPFRKNYNKISQILNVSNIEWTPLKFSTSPPFISKLYDLFKMRRSAIEQYRKSAFKVVHCRSYVAAFTGLYLQRRYGVRFVFDMRGFWVDERIEGNIWNYNNPLHWLAVRYFRKLENKFFRKADAIVSLTNKGREFIGDEFGDIASIRTRVIPCCVDSSLFAAKNISPEEKEEARQKLGIAPYHFVLSYLGSTGTWYKTREMLLFYKRLLKLLPDTLFLFITGDEPGKILHMAYSLDLDPSDIIIIHSEREKVPLYLSLSDISIFFIKPVFSKTASSPTKQGEIMSMGIPFITNSGIGDIDEIVDESQAGILVDGFSFDAFDSAIAKIPEMLGRNRESIRNFAKSRFNLESGVEMYHEIYQAMRLRG
ncbi:MAG TPA: glycosyltransferase [Bacteroidales bacterium]|nr:glycosyltransferase [Bacteroidales bacterium]